MLRRIRGREDGFTLVEMLSAMTVFAIVLASFSMVLSSSIRHSSELEEQSNLEVEARAAISSFAQDARQVYDGDANLLTSPIESMSSTQITFLLARSPAAVPPPAHLLPPERHGQFQRAFATSTDTDGAPWSIPVLGATGSSSDRSSSTTTFAYKKADGTTATTPIDVKTIDMTLIVATKTHADPSVHLQDERHRERGLMIRNRLVREESGIAMVLVVLTAAMVTLLSIFLIDQVRNESTRSVHQVYGGTSFQAAEAGIDDYVSKLVDDRLYYLHYLHPGEATRRSSGGTLVAAGAAWTYGQTWTYPNGKDTWRRLPTGCLTTDPQCYEYNLRVYPPDATSKFVRIVAAGRKAGATTDVHVIETYVRPSSLADYYRVVNGDVSWGAGATTNGKIYANGNVTHDGIATGNIYAEKQISGSVVMQNGAQRYDQDTNPTIRSQIKNPIDFTSFLTSFADIERASQVGGVYLNDASKAAWRISFKSDGTMDVETCQPSGSNDVADVTPVCTAASPANRPVPANGAVYVVQDVIVRNAPSAGGVRGRVTVASNDDIIVGGNITFVTSGTDVLGLVAKNNVYIAKYTPDPLTWSAGVIAQTGTWQARPWSTPLKSLMTFRGMAATDDGGSFAGMFTNRDYGYDPSFEYLPPPWFPVVEDAYTVLFFRELPSTT